ncbi:hypothetical protein [Paenibacillus caui]|nr:hypothetical protein [Paenibacillus caui]
MNPVYPYYEKETVCEEKILTFPPQHQDRQRRSGACEAAGKW